MLRWQYGIVTQEQYLKPLKVKGVSQTPNLSPILNIIYSMSLQNLYIHHHLPIHETRAWTISFTLYFLYILRLFKSTTLTDWGTPKYSYVLHDYIFKNHAALNKLCVARHFRNLVQCPWLNFSICNRNNYITPT